MDRWSVHAAELIGILYAINVIKQVALQRQTLTGLRIRTVTILRDSMSALQAVQNPKTKSGPKIIHAILQNATDAKSHGITIRLQWIPGHCEAPGNDTIDQLARKAAVPGKIHTPIRGKYPRSPRYYLGRRPSSGEGSTLNGRKNGTNHEQAVSFGGLLTHYPPSTRSSSDRTRCCK